MSAHIIKFPWRDFPVTVPPDHKPASISILPVVRIDRGIDPSDLLMIAAANLIAARRRRRLKNLPKLFPNLRT